MVRVYSGKGNDYRRDRKLTNEERRNNVQNKINAHLQMLAAEESDESDE